MGTSFLVSRENLGEVSAEIEKYLLTLKATKKECSTALLLLEEIVVRFYENAEEDSKQCRVRVSKFLGTIYLKIYSKGTSYNPFDSLNSWDTESEEYLRDIIFRTYSSNLSYSRRNGQNIAEIYVHRSENRALYQTALSMVLGIVCGILMKQLPEFVSLIIEENILRTIQTVFLNALSLLLAPIVFFSITTSFSRLSGGNEIGRIGGKVFSSFLFMTAAGTIAGFFVSKMLFASVGQMPSLFEDILQVSSNSNTEFSLHSFLIGIIPKNLVIPIQNGNMIEILFVSVMVGIAMCVLDEKVASLKKIFEEARTLFSRLMGMIVSFMPFVTFSAISLFVYKCTLSSLLTLISYLIAVIVSCLLIFVLQAFMILFLAKVSPLTFFRKILPHLLTAFIVPKRNAFIPITLEYSKKKLGTADKISFFTIPLGAAIHKSAIATCVMIQVVLFAKICGMPFTLYMFPKIALMTILLSMGSNGLVCLMVVLPIAGIPVSLIAFSMSIEDIVDRFRTVTNLSGDLATNVIVSASEKLLDRDKYEK